MMRGWKKTFRARVRRLEDAVWLLGRPKLIVEWYRMWQTFPVTSWLRAADAFINKDFKLAVDYYQRGLAKRPNHPARHCAVMDLAYCRYRTGDLEEAKDLLATLTSQSVALRDAYLLQAKISDFFGKAESSLQTLSDGLVLFPDDLKLMLAYLHTSLFNDLYHARLGEIREQILSMKRSLLLDDDRQVLIDSALAHYELRCGDVESAERMVARVLATGRAPHEVVLIRGERLLVQRRILQAREQLGRVMRMAPRNPRPVRMLAESYLLPEEFHEPDYAEQLATLSCKMTNWKNVECVDLLSRVYDEKGDTSTAELLGERCRGLKLAVELEREQIDSPAEHVAVASESRSRANKLAI